jgi:hypothetical protein
MKETDALGGRRFGREINNNIKPRKIRCHDLGVTMDGVLDKWIY